ncbi:hypothetical protein [Mycobacterium noviomagense]|uniref:Uncharacterized protein n=1 Tax=Mycobacterium noviomagense TaxID=459858 RepID=A0A7I7PA17_9MYCO|nr:hypothetical protein [Mycobacterium noviomagense]ORB15911.1 hypothetical protein BST37_08375 [Mycobacterium noviomagense]BBY05433.1 hypothetical protein MNVI_07510 [Mycobacterium noviomagense]
MFDDETPISKPFFTWDVEDYTPDQAREWLRATVTDKRNFGALYGQMYQLDERSGIRPPLIWVAALHDRDSIVDSAVWPTLADDLRAFLVLVDDSQIAQVTNTVIEAYLTRYRQREVCQ